MINNLTIILILLANASGFMALLHFMIDIKKTLNRIHEFQRLQLDFTKLLVEKQASVASEYIGKLKQ